LIEYILSKKRSEGQLSLDKTTESDAKRDERKVKGRIKKVA
jgi:hypothetical protein